MKKETGKQVKCTIHYSPSFIVQKNLHIDFNIIIMLCWETNQLLQRNDFFFQKKYSKTTLNYAIKFNLAKNIPAQGRPNVESKAQ